MKKPFRHLFRTWPFLLSALVWSTLVLHAAVDGRSTNSGDGANAAKTVRSLATPPDEPMVVLSATSLNFGPQPQASTSKPQIVELANTGDGPLTIASISITGLNATDFAETHNCPVSPAVVEPHVKCAISVVFKPTTTTTLTATLAIADNASGSPQTVTLAGQGTLAVPTAVVTPTQLNFGNRAVGTSSEVNTVTLTNTGSAALNIASITITGSYSAEFRIVTEKTTCPVSGGQVPPNNRCAIALVFSPVSIGSKSAQLTIVDDAAGSPQTVSLAGVGGGTQPSARRDQQP
jgi:hypothetical protein